MDTKKKQCAFCIDRVMIKLKNVGGDVVPLATRRVRITRNKRIRYPQVCDKHYEAVRAARRRR